jgi:hypothetical protein
MALAAMLFLCAGVLGQSGAGSITGSVKDINGAAVPGATVTLTNPASSVSQTATTNEDGVFTSPQLPPGTYTVSVEKEGFKRIEKAGVVLSTGDRLNAGDFVLEAGGVSETVQVVADAGQLQVKTESGERSELITNRQIKDLALNGRNILDLTRTVPGVVNTNQNATSTVTNAAGTFTVNGTRSNMHEVTVDGATNINTGNNSGLLVTINPDALAEVKVLTSNYQAEYGRAGGGFVQMTTKSGTNDFHGTVRYFRRHESLNANNFFNNLRNAPRNLYRFNNGGYDIGGPVYLPRFGEGGPAVWRGKDRLFFFFSQEFYRQLVPEVARNIRVPSAAERAGNFSALLPGTVIRDVNNCLGGGFGAPFPGNVIPSQCWFGGGQILNIYPPPNVAGNSQFNFTSQRSSSYPRREDILRLDYRLGERTSLSGRFIRNQDEQLFSYGTTSASFNYPLTFTSRANGPGYTLGFTLTHSFSPTLVNEFNYAPSRGAVRIAMVDDAGTRRANGITVPLLFPEANPGDAIPGFSFDTNLAATAAFQNQTFAEALFNGSPFEQSFTIDNVSDTMTKVFGNHVVKGGVNWQNSHNKRTSFGPIQSNIEFNFSALDAANALNAGSPYANALLGTFAQYQQASVQLSNDFVYNNFEGFLQDTWKIHPRLTLDYGLRLSHYQPLYDREKQLSFFNPQLFDRSRAPRIYFPVCLGNAAPCASGTNRRAVDPALLGSGFVPTASNTLPANFIGLLVPGTGDITNGLGLASNGYPRGGFESAKVLLGPRFGFAYDMFGDQNTVVRGGFGMTYDRIRGDITIDAITNPPNVLLPTLFFGRLNDIPALRGGGVRAIPSVIGVDPGGELPTVYTYSLGVQRNVGWSTVVDLSYVGHVARHLVRQRNLNAVPYFTTFRAAGQDPTRFAGGVVPSVAAGLPAAYSQAGFSFTGANALPVDFLRPFPGYGDILFRSFDAISNYNSLQVSANRRFKNDFTFGVAYTFSKALTTSSDDAEITHPFDSRRYDYRLASFDRAHVLVINYVFNLPKGSDLFGHHSLARGLFDNWQLSGISQFVSGTPFELSLSGLGNLGARLVGAPTGNAGNLSGQQPRFILVGDPHADGGTNGLQINPNAFAVPAVGNIGPYPRNYLRSPGWNNHDLSVFKNFPLGGEGARYLQLRFEFFNILNHAQFTAYNGGAVTATPGSNTAVFNVRGSSGCAATTTLGSCFGEFSAARDPRIVQLAAKLYF